MLENNEVKNSVLCMDTVVSFQIHGRKAKKAFEKAKAELFRLEKILSRYIEDSEVSKINQLAGKSSISISCETYEVLSSAAHMSEISEGLFDITVTPLLNLWDYKHSFKAPEDDEIKKTLALVNYRDLLLNSEEKTAALRHEGQSIDLGGIGKGYASDKCINVLQDCNISFAFINIGGNVSTLGNKPDGSPWRVGIRHPRQKDGLIGSVKVSGKSVVTSGDYERYFIDCNGNRRHHIINPVTGYPSDCDIISASVIYDSAIIADALSTAILVGGIDRGLKYLEHFPGAEVILVDKQHKIYITRGIKESFQSAQGMETIIM